LHFTYPGVLDPGTPLCEPVIAAWKSLWGHTRKSETILAAREKKQMEHDHGNEYQVRIIHADGTEKLSVWMNSEEQVAQAMAAVHKPQGEAYWLRERNVLCPDCNKEQIIILECPITDIPSPRYRPHDSHYLVAVGSRNWYELPEGVIGRRH
jgi:hypothetical protein